MEKPSLEKKDERKIVNEMAQSIISSKPHGLKSVHKHVNLSRRGFVEVWQGWFHAKTIPQLEVDLITVYEEQDLEPFIMATEVKYFKQKRGRNFYEGLQQILAFGLFGFDALSLLHIFPRESEDDYIQASTKATQEIIERFRLPVTFIAGKYLRKGQIRCYFPVQLGENSADYVMSWTKNLCSEKRNPAVRDQEVVKRRKTLKVLLKIPA